MNLNIKNCILQITVKNKVYECTDISNGTHMAVLLRATSV